MSDDAGVSQQSVPAKPAKRGGFRMPTGVFVVLVLMIVAAAVFFVYEQLKPAAATDLSQYESLDTGAAQMRARMNRGGANGGGPNAAGPNDNRRRPGGPVQPDLVTTRGDGGGDIRIQGARARFFKDGNALKVDLRYTDFSYQPAADRQAIIARIAAGNADQARTAGLNPEQVKQLADIPPVGEMAAPESARKELLDLWAQYRAAPDDQKKPLEQPLIDLLRKTATDSIPTTLVNVKATADKVRAVLTPEQINALRGGRRG